VYGLLVKLQIIGAAVRIVFARGGSASGRPARLDVTGGLSRRAVRVSDLHPADLDRVKPAGRDFGGGRREKLVFFPAVFRRSGSRGKGA
jgi:hypothetical protein